MADLLGGSGAGSAMQAITGPTQPGERRDSVQTRLERVYKVLVGCEERMTAIEDRITGPRADKPSGGTPMPIGLAGLSMEIGNDAERLRDRLEVVLNALG